MKCRHFRVGALASGEMYSINRGSCVAFVVQPHRTYVVSYRSTESRVVIEGASTRTSQRELGLWHVSAEHSDNGEAAIGEVHR